MSTSRRPRSRSRSSTVTRLDAIADNKRVGAVPPFRNRTRRPRCSRAGPAIAPLALRPGAPRSPSRAMPQPQIMLVALDMPEEDDYTSASMQARGWDRKPAGSGHEPRARPIQTGPGGTMNGDIQGMGSSCLCACALLQIARRIAGPVGGSHLESPQRNRNELDEMTVNRTRPLRPLVQERSNQLEDAHCVRDAMASGYRLKKQFEMVARPRFEPAGGHFADEGLRTNNGFWRTIETRSSELGFSPVRKQGFPK